ncbi:MAG: hypothetical protein HY897_24985 [Deltaproteobacteria bacterium]|nr:hypothetical protein [Deltaproteobacteria bacterium]
MNRLICALLLLAPSAAFAGQEPTGTAAPSKAPVAETPAPVVAPEKTATASSANKAVFDPFVAAPARLLDGAGAMLRLNSIPDSNKSALGTQVSVEPLELSAYKKFGPVSAGVRVPLSFNPDRSADDAVMQVLTLDVRAAAVERDSWRLYGGARFDAALNAGITDAAATGRGVSHTLAPFAIAALRFGAFAPQLNVTWHHAFETKTYAGAWYADASRGFAVDAVLPYHFPEEKLTVFVELSYDRDIDRGKNRGFVTPGVRFLPAKIWHFGLAVAVPVLDEAFADATGIGVILGGGYEFD